MTTARTCESTLLQVVQEYTRLVIEEAIDCPFTTCPACSRQPTVFKRHDTRYRIFYVITNDGILRTISMVTRWKCTLCKRTFTGYPEFALPYKRYLLPDMVNLAANYLEDDRQTYRRTVLRNNAEIYHKCSDGRECGSPLAHTTLHRWIGTLGKMLQTVAKALDYIKQKLPQSNIFREVSILVVHPRKYRSLKRKDLLLRCRTLLRVQEEFVRIFSNRLRQASIFPKLAAKCSWS
jgi:transposase-like protein